MGESIKTSINISRQLWADFRVKLIREGKKVIYRLHQPCLWFPDLDIPASVCQAIFNFEREACRLVNPKVKATANKIMTAGDPVCETVFEEIED